MQNCHCFRKCSNQRLLPLSLPTFFFFFCTLFPFFLSIHSYPLSPSSSLFAKINHAPTLNRPLSTSDALLEQNLAVNPSLDPTTFWIYIALIGLLVLSGGLFAGLTLGLLSLDLTSLDVLAQSGDPNEKRYAKIIKPVRQQGHWLLVTLLLANVIVNESLPILTDNLWGGGWPAVVISTTLIVIFGEIIPQAVCSRYGLGIGASCTWLVKLLMVFFSPIAYPISKLLDYILGKTEGFTYKRAELKALVALHEKSEAHFGPLSTDEVTIIKAVLELRDKNVRSILTPLDDIYMLSTEQILNETKIQEIVDKGHSRIPVYNDTDRKDIRGMLLVKKLASYDPHQQLKVKEFTYAIASLPIVSPRASCFEILDLFQTGRSHMAIIAESGSPLSSKVDLNKEKASIEVLGIVTLEDIVEEMIGEEIIDETDIYVDVTRKLPVSQLKSVRLAAYTGMMTSLTLPLSLNRPSSRNCERTPQSQNEEEVPLLRPES